MSEWIQCPNCGTVMTITTNGYLCPMCGTVLPVKILHMTSGTSLKVDAVPVIRCKDCRHHYYHELLKQDYCEIPNMQFGEIDPNGYCHRAERREHETD